MRYYFHCTNCVGGGNFVNCQGSMAAQYQANQICVYMTSAM